MTRDASILTLSFLSLQSLRKRRYSRITWRAAQPPGSMERSIRWLAAPRTPNRQRFWLLPKVRVTGQVYWRHVGNIGSCQPQLRLFFCAPQMSQNLQLNKKKTHTQSSTPKKGAGASLAHLLRVGQPMQVKGLPYAHCMKNTRWASASWPHTWRYGDEIFLNKTAKQSKP